MDYSIGSKSGKALLKALQRTSLARKREELAYLEQVLPEYLEEQRNKIKNMEEALND